MKKFVFFIVFMFLMLPFCSSVFAVSNFESPIMDLKVQNMNIPNLGFNSENNWLLIKTEEERYVHLNSIIELSNNRRYRMDMEYFSIVNKGDDSTSYKFIKTGHTTMVLSSYRRIDIIHYIIN